MKLVRYGAPGREKPGMIDKEGGCATCRKSFRYFRRVLSPKSLSKLSKVKADKLPLVRGTPRTGPASARSAISSLSGSIIPITPPRPYGDPQRAGHLQQGADLHLRPNDDT